MNAGQIVLNFFTQFIGTPAILIGLFAMIGSILQRKKWTEILSSTFKTMIGFLIIGGGAGIIAGSIGKLGAAFNLLFGVSGIVSNNDVIPSLFIEHLPNIVLSGSLIMISAMALNILLARITRYKYIYLTGHALFYFSCCYASVLYMAGLNDDKSIATIVISGAFLVSLWMVVSPAMLNKHVVRITGSDDLAIAHTGSISYLIAASVGELVGKIKKGNVKSTEDIKFPQGLAFLRNTNVAIGLTMLIVYLVIYFTAWGVHGYQAMVDANVIAQGNDPFVQGLLQSFTFAAGVEVVLIGVRMFIAEIVPAFQGISQKVVPNAKPALDCPTIFPYAPNAVLIGFLSSFTAGIIGMGITIGLTQSINFTNKEIVGWAIIIPSIVPHFFIGAGAGVFGNAKGGIWGAILGSFLSGLLTTFVPFIFFGLQLMPSMRDNGGLLIATTWGDIDYMLGIPFALFAKAIGVKNALWAIPVIGAVLWLLLPASILIKRKESQKESIQKSGFGKIETSDIQNALQVASELDKKYKIVAVCGQGLGSSLLIEMNLKKVITKLDIQNIEITHTNVNSFNNADDSILAVICGADLANSINYENKIILNNLLSEEEAKQKIVNFLSKKKKNIIEVVSNNINVEINK